MGGAFLRAHEAAAKARRAAEAEAVEVEVPVVEPDSVSPFEALTDDELFEAYVTNVGDDGSAESREDMTAELMALGASE